MYSSRRRSIFAILGQLHRYSSFLYCSSLSLRLDSLSRAKIGMIALSCCALHVLFCNTNDSEHNGEFQCAQPPTSRRRWAAYPVKLRSPSELSQHALGVEVSGEDELSWSRITSYELCGSGPLIAQQVGGQKKKGGLTCVGILFSNSKRDSWFGMHERF